MRQHHRLRDGLLRLQKQRLGSKTHTHALAHACPTMPCIHLRSYLDKTMFKLMLQGITCNTGSVCSWGGARFLSQLIDCSWFTPIKDNYYRYVMPDESKECLVGVQTIHQVCRDLQNSSHHAAPKLNPAPVLNNSGCLLLLVQCVLTMLITIKHVFLFLLLKKCLAQFVYAYECKLSISYLSATQ